MYQDSPLVERLHQATRLAQRRLERRVDSYRPNFDVDNYRRLLQDFWGFYQPMERKLVVLTNHDLPSPYSQKRRKAPRLEQDLLSLGMTQTNIAALPLCGRLPAIPTLPQVFGVLYVIDGVALGELGVRPSQGGSFFSSLGSTYDPLVNNYWQELFTITAAVEGPNHQDLAIQSAMDALECFETWLEHRKQSHPRNSARTDSMRWNSPLEPCSALSA